MFGEIDRQWGIFWRPLEGIFFFSHKYTIDRALRLHNFIVDYREEINTNEINEQRKERAELDVAAHEFMMKNPLAIQWTREGIEGKGRNIEGFLQRQTMEEWFKSPYKFDGLCNKRSERLRGS